MLFLFFVFALSQWASTNMSTDITLLEVSYRYQSPARSDQEKIFPQQVMVPKVVFKTEGVGEMIDSTIYVKDKG
jgi:hypothetical protein